MTRGRLGYAVSRVSHSRKTSLAYCAHTGLGLSARRRWRKGAGQPYRERDKLLRPLHCGFRQPLRSPGTVRPPNLEPV